MKRRRCEFRQPMIGQLQPRMLSGNDQIRPLAKRGERMGDGT